MSATPARQVKGVGRAVKLEQASPGVRVSSEAPRGAGLGGLKDTEQQTSCWDPALCAWLSPLCHTPELLAPGGVCVGVGWHCGTVVRLTAHIPALLLLTWSPADAPGKAAEDVPSTWTPVRDVGDAEGVPSPWPCGRLGKEISG